MKRNLPLITAFFLAGAINAQTVDTVSVGAGYANENYYSLSDGGESSIARDDWDIAFGADGLGGSSSTIHINGGMGAELFIYSTDVNDWASVDTTGFAWGTSLLNSDVEWGNGAFSNHALTDAYDLGWGAYNMITHVVEANRIFIIKIADGSYKKIKINSLSGGVYSFTYANVDGSNEIDETLTKADFSGKNFGYYSIQNGQEVDREPLSSTWDLLFAKYVVEVAPGMNYGVSGVLTNAGVKVVQKNQVDLNTVSHIGETFESNIGMIGYDWKSFNMTTYLYDIEDSLVYFVEDPSGDIYSLIFTGFGGSANGDYIFTKELVGSSVSVEEVESNQVLALYPNPASEQITLSYATSNSELSIALFDITGKQVYNQQLNVVPGLNQEIISVSHLPAGIYQLSLITNQSITTQKLIIK